MNKISLCLIVQNEEQYINKCLSYHSPYFDEIVIVDGGSTDNTVELCKKYTNKIYVRRFDHDFSAQRNYAIEQCSNEWIFMVDADEILEKELIDNLNTIIYNFGNDYDLFYLPRINTLSDLDKKPWLIQKYGWQVNKKGYINYPDYQGRFFKSHCRFYGRVHERITNTHKIGILDDEAFCGNIIHEKDWNRQEKQNDYYGTIQR